MPLSRVRSHRRAAASGFTLVELLIVVIILAILAAIVVPQFIASTDDAKTAALDSNLRNLRAAVALYYQQHNDYPGATDSGLASGGPDTEISFVGQLTQYTDAAGDVNATKTATHIYGPYLTRASMPPDPFKSVSATVIVNTGSLPLIADVANPGGWKFDTTSGALVMNDQAYDDR